MSPPVVPRLLFQYLVLFLGCAHHLQGARSKNPQFLIKGVTVIGKEISISRTQRGTAFLGVPYASPPLNELRFSPPMKISWPQEIDRPIFNATSFRPSCHQRTQNIEKAMGRYLYNLLAKQPGVDVSYQREDCLYLNVYVPEGRPPMDSGGWPVVIWFHPGDFSSGTPILWDPTAFVIKQKVIVVSPAYRLDIFGFLSLENDNIPGNFGLMDQVAAMDWVQDHIGLFNGSRNDVMIWGHSAGGTSVTLHLASDHSTKKFHRAIAMSGNAFLPDSIVQPRRNVVLKYFLEQEYGCTRDGIEDCLRNLDFTALKKASEELPEELKDPDAGPWRWGPVIDGYFVEDNPFLKDDPVEMFKTKRTYKVPVIAGFTDMESLDTGELDNVPLNKKTFQDSVTKIFYEIVHLEGLKYFGNDSGCALNEDFVVNSILFHYLPTSPDRSEDQTLFRRRYIELTTDRNYGAGTYGLGRALSSTDAFTYLYRFDYKMKSTGMSINRDWVGVPHQYDLPIFWGMPYWTTISPPIIWNNIDKKTSDIVMSLVGNFTRYSVPMQTKKPPHWERFSELSPRLLIMDKTFNMSDSNNFDYKSVNFWNDYYPTVIESVSNCCNATASTMFIPSQPLLFGSIFLHFSLAITGTYSLSCVAHFIRYRPSHLGTC